MELEDWPQVILESDDQDWYVERLLDRAVTFALEEFQQEHDWTQEQALDALLANAGHFAQTLHVPLPVAMQAITRRYGGVQ